MESLEERITSLGEKSAAQSLSKEIKLPDCPTTKRATPNSFLRSALFSAIQSKDREFLDGVILASQKGITIRFTQYLRQKLCSPGVNSADFCCLENSVVD